MNLIKRNKIFCISGYLLFIAFLHVNAILKAEDPIADTQTEAILYDQKMEQDKDGVKAPATPKMIYYGGQGFLTKSSLTKYEKEIASATKGSKKDKFSWSDWWEDKPAETQPSGADSGLVDVLPEVPQNLDAAVMDEGNIAPQKFEAQAKKTEQKTPSEEGGLSENAPDMEPSNGDASLLTGDGDKKTGDDWW